MTAAEWVTLTTSIAGFITAILIATLSFITASRSLKASKESKAVSDNIEKKADEIGEAVNGHSIMVGNKVKELEERIQTLLERIDNLQNDLLTTAIERAKKAELLQE